MRDGTQRRQFLKNVLASPVSRLALGGTTAVSQASPAGPRVFSGSKLRQISFPLGGIGTGTIGLGGRGDLRDWADSNHPDQGNSPAYAFAAMWVHQPPNPPMARILEAEFLPPYDGPRGLGAINAPRLPRFQSAEFSADFLIANVRFSGPAVPVRVSLEAFNPLYTSRSGRLRPTARSGAIFRDQSQPERSRTVRGPFHHEPSGSRQYERIAQSGWIPGARHEESFTRKAMTRCKDRLPSLHCPQTAKWKCQRVGTRARAFARVHRHSGTRFRLTARWAHSRSRMTASEHFASAACRPGRNRRSRFCSLGTFRIARHRGAGGNRRRDRAIP
jgi:hypothetical protein